MDKRVILAFLLSAVVLTIYSYWLAPQPKETVKQPAQPTETENSPTPPPPPSLPSVAPSTPTVPVDSKPEREIQVRSSLWSGAFTSRGAVAKDWILEQMPNGKPLKSASGERLNLLHQGAQPRTFQLDFPKQAELTKRVNSSVFEVDSQQNELTVSQAEQRLVFTLQEPDGLLVRKIFTFYPDKFRFDLAVEAKQGETPLPVQIIIGPGFGDASAKVENSYTTTPPQAMGSINGSVERFNTIEDNNGVERLAGPLEWAAISDHYFAFIAVPQVISAETTIFDLKRVDAASAPAFNPLMVSVPVQNTASFYIGPKDRYVLFELSESLNKAYNRQMDLEDVIDYGMFRVLIKPVVPIISWSLNSLHNLVPNYGWAIIIFTVAINLLFFPLKWKSSVAMKKAQKMQPKMKELQEKMKGLKKDHPDYQKLQMEQVALMKEGNPLQGCLPLLIQMPIFWAVFVYLSISIYVRQSPWVGWINDLSSPDPYYVLPVIMCVSMIAQSALTPTPTDAQQRIQKYMMTWAMPILFTVLFFIKAPSGLVIYWMFSNLVGVGQQVIINKFS